MLLHDLHATRQIRGRRQNRFRRQTVPALILLLAACEQARHELDQAGVVADGLREELNTLSVRLQDVLVEERRKPAT
jgi:hypothetical protein